METHDIGSAVRAKLLAYTIFACSQIAYKHFFFIFLETLAPLFLSIAHLLISFLLTRLLLSVVLLYFFCHFMWLKTDYKWFTKTV